jgi:hypothetical protein
MIRKCARSSIFSAASLFRSRLPVRQRHGGKPHSPAIMASRHSMASAVSPAPNLQLRLPLSPMSKRPSSPNARRWARRSARVQASTLFIDPATRTNLELVKTQSGDRNGTLFKAHRSHRDRRRCAVACRTADVAADGSRAYQRAARFHFCPCRPAVVLQRLAVRAEGHVPDMPRALSRLSLGRGGPRDLGSILAAVASCVEVAGLLGKVASCPRNWVRHFRLSARCHQDMVRTSTRRLATSCLC